jgi:hypothetical protein
MRKEGEDKEEREGVRERERELTCLADSTGDTSTH